MGRLKNLLIGYFLFQIHFADKCNAQSSGDIFYSLTTENGLSSNRVNNIIQDHEGFYWIATQNGLSCFDGSTCRVFRNIKNDSTSLSHNDCLLLVEDKHGDIWIGTQVGLNRYKRKEGKFERIFFNNSKYSFEQVNGIRGLTKDDEGNIWVCSAGLWQYNISTNKWKTYLNDPDDPASLPPGFAGFLQFDKNNHKLWFTSRYGFTFFDPASQKFYHEKNDPSHLALFKVKDDDGIFTLDTKSNIWFHTISNKLYKYSVSGNKLDEEIQLKYQGLSHLSIDSSENVWLHYWIGNTLIFNAKTGTLDSSFLRYTHPQSPLTLFTKGLYIDKEGNYWIFSNKGINIYNPAEQPARYYILSDQKKMTRSLYFAISCIAEQNDSIIWVGTNDGLYQYNTYQEKARLFTDIKVRDNFIRCLFIQHDSILWIGGHHELIRYDIRQKKILQRIDSIQNAQVITEDAKNNIWVATWYSGLFKISIDGKQYKQFLHSEDTLKTPFSNAFLCLSPSPDKSYAWMGYNGGAGFSQIDFNSGLFSNFKIATFSFYKGISNSVNCITEDRNRNLWLGTYGGGLTFYDRNKKTYSTFTQSDGLAGNFINGIVEDNNSHLWIETTNGLSIIDMKSHSIINSEMDLSQESNDYFQNGLLRKNKHVLFFANNKIIEIDPLIFLQSTSPSKIVYSSFKIFDKEIVLSRSGENGYELKLPHSQNFFSFEYSLLKPDPKKITQYAYKLQGFDHDWNYVGERRNAYYTNVPPGHYTFSVQAADIIGKWKYFSEPVNITISPPYWQTWWFMTIIFLAIAGSVYLFFRYRINQLRKIYLLRSKISRDLHDEIASTLSGIRLYSELAKQQLEQKTESKVKESLEIISSNASEMKGGISDIVWAINPSNDSFKAMMEKLKLYAAEVTRAARISFEFEMSAMIPDEKLDMPQRRNIYLICKESVNNALKYSRAEILKVQIQQQDQVMVIEISDNGMGFDPQNVNLGNGIFNIKRRAEEIGALVSIQSAPGKGSRIQLKIRL